MDQIRRARLAAVIQEELSVVIPQEVKDPRVPSITITSVSVTQDGSQATVFVTILGGTQVGPDGAPAISEEAARRRMKECIEGLISASGYLRRHLARVLSVRHIPLLIFKEDRGLENTLRVHELLKKISETG
jgi:ribosome-binding factor A